MLLRLEAAVAERVAELPQDLEVLAATRLLGPRSSLQTEAQAESLQFLDPVEAHHLALDRLAIPLRGKQGAEAALQPEQSFLEVRAVQLHSEAQALDRLEIAQQLEAQAEQTQAQAVRAE